MEVYVIKESGFYLTNKNHFSWSSKLVNAALFTYEEVKKITFGVPSFKIETYVMRKVN